MRKFISDGYTGVAVAVLLFFVLLYPLTRPFPYTDDWLYINPLVDSGQFDFSWLFSLHNDHRIPLQKILHLGLLMLTGGDFRILIAANVMTAAATSVCWIMFSRVIKQESTWSEWIVPAVLLGFGFNTVAWGFSFTFMSSLFFLALANLTWVQSLRAGSGDLGAKTFLALTLCAWCGGNGLVTSTIVGAGFFAAVIYKSGIRTPSWKTWSSLVIWGITVAAILAQWKASAATEATASEPEQYIQFFIGMFKSWFGIFAMGDAAVKTAVALVVFLAAFCGSLLLMIQRKAAESQPSTFLLFLPVFLSVLQALAMVIVVTVSRAGAQPWFPGLELHYGYLVTALPLSAWIVILMLPKGVLRQLPLALLALVIGIAYETNAVWRINAAQDDYRRYAATVADILSPMGAAEVAHRHIRQFYWVEGTQAESAVSNGLSLLRKTAFWSQLK